MLVSKRTSALALLTALPGLAAPDWSALNPAIVRVQVVGKETATGFVLSVLPQEIRIGTAKHVLEGGGDVRIYFNSDQARPFKATALDKASDALDLAVVVVTEKAAGRPLPSGIPRIAPRVGAFPKAGDAVWTVDYAWRPAPNTVLSPNLDVDPLQFEYTKGSVTDGFSGGPIFDGDGKLVGIHRGGREGGSSSVGVKWTEAAKVFALLDSEPRNIGTAVTFKAGSIEAVVEKAKRAREELQLPAGTKRTNLKDGLVYVRVPGGQQFRMGCSATDKECNRNNELPSHLVQVDGFWLGESEVTQEAYTRVTGKTISDQFERGANLPVETASWVEAQQYCAAIGTGSPGRLPTEAEWEYAARAGSPEPRYGDVDAIGWYEKNSGGKLHEVKGKAPNVWGLHDMLGNVWEWVNDRYGKYEASLKPIVNPKGPSSGKSRVLRGGAYAERSSLLRASERTDGIVPSGRMLGESLAGFRCALDVLP